MPRQIWNSGGSARWPSAMRRFASSIWPRSKTSISGFAPAAFARSAISRKWLGVCENPLAEVHRGDVERADRWLDRLDVAHADGRRRQRRAFAGLPRLGRVRREAPAG